MLTKADIRRHSGYLPESEKEIPPLRAGYYVVDSDVSIAGDAPKDFVRVYEPGTGRKRNVKTWPAYVVKLGHKWYPSESITEHLLTRIGQTLRFNMADSRLVRAEGQVRFMSRYFLRPHRQQLVHGAEIFAQHLQDEEFVRQAEEAKLDGDMLDFQFVHEAVRAVFKDPTAKAILEDYVRMLAFDAIVGNNDRHHYNWGVVVDIRGTRSPQFSPIYDTARSLFWNHGDAQVAMSNGSSQREKFLDGYIRRASPKIGWNGRGRISHFELVSLIVEGYPAYRPLLSSIIAPNDIGRVRAMMRREFASIITTSRFELILECLEQRMGMFCRIVNAGGTHA